MWAIFMTEFFFQAEEKLITISDKKSFSDNTVNPVDQFRNGLWIE